MKTLAIFTIFVLIFGTAPAVLSDAYAQNDPYILLRIATQADTQIQHQLDSVYGDSVPSEIQELYQKGHMAVLSLEESLPDNLEQARQDFLTTMKSFKQITRMISEPTTDSASTSAQTTDRDPSSELDRLVKYVQKLKTVSATHNIEINFDRIDYLIDHARNQIANNEDHSETLDQIKHLITFIEKDIRSHDSHGSSDRVKDFVLKQLEEIETKLDRAQEAAADQTQIDIAHQLVAEVRELISNNQIDDAKNVFHELNELLKEITR